MRYKSLASILFIFLLVSTSAFALGISPSRKIIEFNSDLNQEGSLTILNGENKDLDVIIYPRGELANYILVEKSSMHISASQKEVSIKYKINVPYTARKPGENLVEIVVEEATTDYDKETAINGKIAVVHQLILKAPYLGKYARMVLSSNNPDFDQEPSITYTLFNEGTEFIDSFNIMLEVYSSESELIKKDSFTVEGIASGEYKKYSRQTEKLNPGSYYAILRAEYGGKVITQQVNFVVGGQFIEIEGIGSSDFKLGGINKVDVSVYNKINQEVKNVYAEVIVKDDKDKIYNIFKTISVDLMPVSGNTLFGYWDTSSLYQGTYYLLVKAYYNDEVVEKEFEAKILQNELRTSSLISGNVVAGKSKVKDPTITILIVSFIILMIVNVLLVSYIRRNKNPPPTNQITNMMLFNFILISIIIEIFNRML